MTYNQKNISVVTLINLSMLFLVFLILCYIYSSKEMLYPFHYLSTPGMLAFPIALILLDIIAEIYGYMIAKYIFWASVIAQGFFFLIGDLFAYLPDPNTLPGAIPAITYQTIFSVLPRIFISVFLGMLFGVLVNARLITKWKLLLKGKFFWLRSIGSSGIGDGICIFTGTFLSCIGRFPLGTIFKFSITNYLIEITILIILAPLAQILTITLKILLKDQIKENETLCNPFTHYQTKVSN